MNNESPELIPVRILNEFVYCPRLAYIEWVQSEFADNIHTESGRYEHRIVDQPKSRMISGEEDGASDGASLIHERSIRISAPELGLNTIIDLIEGDDTGVIPVEYKHGKKPRSGPWLNDQVQVCAQGLVLRENGYTSSKGVIYYIASKKKVEVVFDEDLISRTLETIRELRSIAMGNVIPPPLADSPKCPSCSLVTICLPDEVNFLAQEDAEEQPGIRRLIPSSVDPIPLYIQNQGTTVGKSGDNLILTANNGERQDVRIMDVSQVSIFGGIQISTQAVQTLCHARIPIAYFSHGGWFYGMTTGLGHKNVELRKCQYGCAGDPAICLAIARRIVECKIRNCRTILRRNSSKTIQHALSELSLYGDQAKQAGSIPSLLGIEGNAARIYFEHFPMMFKSRNEDGTAIFDFNNRNRRPPKDPVNALLSFAYSLLTKDMVVTLQAAGLDPYQGFYHQVKYGRPALALDLIEEFRPLIADSTVISVLNNKVIQVSDFVRAGDAVNLTSEARKRFIESYERRMEQMVTHPIFKYRVNYRQVMDLQARLFGRYLTDEIAEYPMFMTR